MAAHWPGASGPFARPMNEIPKVVFSDSLASADWVRRRSPPETWPKPSRGTTVFSGGAVALVFAAHP